MAFRYENLDVCKDIQALILEIYNLTSKFPSDERFGLTTQARRAGTSILLNIAEGSARKTNKEFCRFITYSLGSITESHSIMKTALSLGFVTQLQYDAFSIKAENLWRRLCALRTSQST